jgi:Ca2+-binding RTX toxin-like protein
MLQCLVILTDFISKTPLSCAQALDHLLVSKNLLSNAQFDAVHINSEQPDTAARATDHDAVLATLLFNSAPVAQDVSASGNEDMEVNGNLIATDKNGDALAYLLVDGPANGTVVVNAVGNFIYIPDANFNGTVSFTYRASDGLVNSAVQTVTLTINPVNEAPTDIALDAMTVAENAANGTVVATATATDVDADDSRSFSLVNNAGGRFAINAATGVVTVANGALLDFESATSHNITARVTDQGGQTRDLNLSINVIDVVEGGTPINGTNGFDFLIGTSGNDIINALDGSDIVSAGSGNDIIFGGAGRDSINGDAGNDILDGGSGADTLSGGAGQDIFRYTSLNDAPRATGASAARNREIISDFNATSGANQDLIDLSAIDANSSMVGDQAFIFVGSSAFSGAAGQLRYANGLLQADVNGDQVADLEIFLSNLPQLDQTDFIL